MMRMVGHHRCGEGDGFGSSCLRQNEAIPLVEGDAPPEVGQGKGRLAVSPVRGANEIKERFIFGDGEQLSLTEHPSGRCEITGEHLDFSHIRLCHCSTELELCNYERGGKTPCRAMQK